MTTQSDAADLTAEEFTRLQEEMMALKMHNWDLEESNRRVRHGGAAPPPPPTGASGSRSTPSRNPTSPSESAGTAVAVSTGPDEQVAVLQAEVVSLRERLRSAQDELSSTRSEARDAQQSAAAAQTRKPPPPPGVDDLRHAILRGSSEEDPINIRAIADDLLLLIAQAGLQLATVQPSACSEGPADGQDQHLSLLVKIQEQQKELEKWRSAVDKQDGEVKALQDKTAEKRTSDNKLPLEERVKVAEKQVEDLVRRLAASEGVSSQMYELRCHLNSVGERVRQRDTHIEKIQLKIYSQARLRELLREQFAFAQEDLCSVHRRLEEEREQMEASSSSNAAIAGESCLTPTTGETKPCLSTLTSDPHVPLLAVGVQTESEELSQSDSTLEEIANLRAQLEELRLAKTALEKKRLRELQELRVSIKELQRKAQMPEQFNIGGDDDVEDDDMFGGDALSGLLYRQKITELEELQVGLTNDLEMLRSSRQLLLDDCRQKEDLVASMMRELRPDDRPDESYAQAPVIPKRNALSQFLGIGRREAQANREEREELERVAEEAMLDNVRLKRDLGVLAEEFRKSFGDAPAAP